ncbi:pseudaminic acid cytidylyltransferase [Butyrivibrio sp. MC2013]|uniref:pseudaminic acid cytidylyltransferase n=1 Tax=Butyrivibrio sp. MC2013 TaxID=1280686 RepID=UPI000417C7C3|nr:pseudaminic acid cytidylyltransferase [Butyrivibrio sp. MC2013]
MSAIAIITARGGSKRIPHKNIRSFLGKPIINYSIEAALESGVFDEVMVSTDSKEIADIAKMAGASVPFLRSEKTSSDYATTAEVLNEVLLNYKSLGKKFDFMCCIYPTAPFVTADKLKKAMLEMIANKADSVMPVVQFSYPPQRGYVLRDGRIYYQHPEYATTRSQDLEPIYHDAGQFYFYRLYDCIKWNGSSYVPIIVPETEVQDIDNMSDWEIAELKYQRFIKYQKFGSVK